MFGKKKDAVEMAEREDGRPFRSRLYFLSESDFVGTSDVTCREVAAYAYETDY